jgi:hypothetical protein
MAEDRPKMPEDRLKRHFDVFYKGLVVFSGV